MKLPEAIEERLAGEGYEVGECAPCHDWMYLDDVRELIAEALDEQAKYIADELRKCANGLRVTRSVSLQAAADAWEAAATEIERIGRERRG